MSEKIFLQKGEGSLRVYDDESRELVKSWPIGEVISCDVRRPRNPGHHRKAFALMRILYDNQDRFDNFELFRKLELHIKLGWFDEYITGDGELVYIPRSINWASMGQDSFDRDYWKPLIRLALTDYMPNGMTEAQLQGEIELRIGFM